MKKEIAFLLVSTLGSIAFSQPAVPAAIAKPTVTLAAETAQVETEEPDKIIARFFAALQRKEVDQACDQLFRGTRIEKRADAIKTIRSWTKDALAIFGPILGYETVEKKAVGTRLVKYTVISLGKEFPLRWDFTFYKSQDSWKLIDIRPWDRLAPIFGETDEGRTREDRP